MKGLISKLTVMSRRRGGETLKFGIKKLHKGEFPSVKSRKERPEGGGGGGGSSNPISQPIFFPNPTSQCSNPILVTVKKL